LALKAHTLLTSSKGLLDPPLSAGLTTLAIFS
jgi:hypothetical protein